MGRFGLCGVMEGGGWYDFLYTFFRTVFCCLGVFKGNRYYSGCFFWVNRVVFSLDFLVEIICFRIVFRF